MLVLYNYFMISVFLSVFLYLSVSLSLPFLLKRDYLWASLTALLITQIFKILSARISSQAPRKNFSQVLQSTVDTAVTFIVIASFGYAGIVHWAIIAPLLIASYLIGYMGLRIGIATKANAPLAMKMELISVPVALGSVILAKLYASNAMLAKLDVANCIGLALLILFVVLVFLRLRLAYRLLLAAKV